MQAHGHRLTIYSLWGGGGAFQGLPVHRFSMWRLLELVWVIPSVAVSRWDVFGVIWRGLWTRKAPCWLNFWENMLGAGFVGIFRHRIRLDKPDIIHAAWGGAPATAAWMLRRLDGYGYSAAAHAYDIYEYRGDWWLDEKLSEAGFIHTSTEMGRKSLEERGHDPDRIHVVRRGLEVFPICRPLRINREPLHLVSIARLVAKKGFAHQLEIYRRLAVAGIKFEARIVGEGEERNRIERWIEEYELEENVRLLGLLDQEAVKRELAWADALLHTGVVAASGDRDGLPNVIPEAMAHGVLVLTSPHAATTEAVADQVSGWVLAETDPDQWVEALRSIQADSPALDKVRLAARAWTEENYDGIKNAARLSELFREVAER